MSIETDEMNYYAQLDRDDARESRVQSEADKLAADAYDWLAERFGEDLACALMPDSGVVEAPEDTIIHACHHFELWAQTEADMRISHV